MKSIFFIVLTILSFTVFSQEPIAVRESNESFSVGNVNALTANVHCSDIKFVEKAWKKAMKKYDGSVKDKSEIFADNILIKKMSANTIDVYAKVRASKEESVEILVAVDLGGAFLSRSLHQDKYKIFENILHDFAVEVSKEAIKGQVDEQQKVLDKIVKAQENLVSDNDNYHKSIEDYKKKIEDAEKAIEQNLKDQEAKKAEIETQKQVLMGLTEREKAIK